MSMDINVCWRGALQPSRTELAQALAALGFEATVLHDFRDNEGYWPIDIAGYKTGVFTSFNDDLSELKEFYPVLSEALDGRDKGVTLSFGSDSAEAGAVLAIAAALARLGDVILYEPSEGVVFPAEQAANEAREMFDSAKREGYRERQDEDASSIEG